MLLSIDICQIKLSTGQYHMTISRAEVYSSLRSCVLFKLTTDQMQVFNWIMGSCQVKLLKTELGCLKSVDSNPGLKVNQITIVSFIEIFLQLLFSVSVL